jgi:hypothetical protein
MDFAFDRIGMFPSSRDVGCFMVESFVPGRASKRIPARMYIMLAGVAESRMIENCPLTKRRDCSPGAFPVAAQTGQPAGDLP